MYEDSVLFSEAVESLRHGIAHYLFGRSEDRVPAILQLHRAMELLFKLRLETLGIEWDRSWRIPKLVRELQSNDVQIHIGYNRLNDLRNAVKHQGGTPSKKDFESLVRRYAFPLLGNFLTSELESDLEEVLPIDYCEVLKGGEVNWDLRSRVLAMAAVEYLGRDLERDRAEAVRIAKRALEEAVRGLASENQRALKAWKTERAGEGHDIPPVEEWRFGDVLEAFLWPVLGDGTEDNHWVPYSGFILDEDVDKIKKSIIPCEARESPPRYLAYRFVTTACDWTFRFADALQLTPRLDLTEDIRLKWPSLVDSLQGEEPYLQAMLAKIDPESIEMRGNTVWIRGYQTEDREELDKSDHKQAIMRAILSRCRFQGDLKICFGNPLDAILGPPSYERGLERLRARVQRLQTGEKGLGDRTEDEWDEW